MDDRIAQLAEPMLLAGRLKAKVQRVDRQGRGHLIAYIDARDVYEILDAVVGPAAWHTRAVGATPVGAGEGRHAWVATVELTVEHTGADGRPCPVSRCGMGTGEGRDLEVAAKGAESDAIKRAAVAFGIGRVLYTMPDLTVRMAEGGRYPADQRDIDQAISLFEAHLAEEGGAAAVAFGTGGPAARAAGPEPVGPAVVHPAPEPRTEAEDVNGVGYLYRRYGQDDAADTQDGWKARFDGLKEWSGWGEERVLKVMNAVGVRSKKALVYGGLWRKTVEALEDRVANARPARGSDLPADLGAASEAARRVIDALDATREPVPEDDRYGDIPF